MPIILVCHFEGGSFLGQRTIAKRYNSIFFFRADDTSSELGGKGKECFGNKERKGEKNLQKQGRTGKKTGASQRKIEERGNLFPTRKH